MIKVKEVIVCEGRYDKDTLSQVFDAVIIETGGFGVFNDREKLALLRCLAEARGLVILTDSDGAGFQIRGYLKGAIDPKLVKHAYIPDIPGRERRKKTASKAGTLGVEGMRPEVLVEALRRAGATFEGAESSGRRSRGAERRGHVRPGPERQAGKRRAESRAPRRAGVAREIAGRVAARRALGAVHARGAGARAQRSARSSMTALAIAARSRTACGVVSSSRAV